jgi:hypothetical protein
MRGGAIAPPAAAWPNYAHIAHVNAPEKKAVVISYRLRFISISLIFLDRPRKRL